MDAIAALGRVLKRTAERTAAHDGFGCAKLVIFANAPNDNPFMAGAFHGVGEPDCVINIGVSGPGVVKAGARDLIAHAPMRPTLGEIAEEIKSTAFRVTRVGELIGREVAARLGVAFGIVDLSLAPTPQVGDSVGEILQAMGIARIGAPGSTAALALLNDAVKKGGSFASSSVGGLSGAFVAVSEDAALARAVADGDLTLAKLEAMTAVCSVGLDMIAVPGDTDAETLAALIADEVAIGVINHKTTAVRVIPVPGKGPGELAVFGGLFGEMPILPIHAAGGSAAFVRTAGGSPRRCRACGIKTPSRRTPPARNGRQRLPLAWPRRPKIGARRTSFDVALFLQLVATRFAHALRRKCRFRRSASSSSNRAARTGTQSLHRRVEGLPKEAADFQSDTARSVIESLSE